MKKNKLWSFALAGALAVSNLSAVAMPFASITAYAAPAAQADKAITAGKVDTITTISKDVAWAALYEAPVATTSATVATTVAGWSNSQFYKFELGDEIKHEGYTIKRTNSTTISIVSDPDATDATNAVFIVTADGVDGGLTAKAIQDTAKVYKLAVTEAVVGDILPAGSGTVKAGDYEWYKPTILDTAGRGSFKWEIVAGTGANPDKDAFTITPASDGLSAKVTAKDKATTETAEVKVTYYDANNAAGLTNVLPITAKAKKDDVKLSVTFTDIDDNDASAVTFGTGGEKKKIFAKMVPGDDSILNYSYIWSAKSNSIGLTGTPATTKDITITSGATTGDAVLQLNVVCYGSTAAANDADVKNAASTLAGVGALVGTKAVVLGEKNFEVAVKVTTDAEPKWTVTVPQTDLEFSEENFAEQTVVADVSVDGLEGFDAKKLVATWALGQNTDGTTALTAIKRKNAANTKLTETLILDSTAFKVEKGFLALTGLYYDKNGDGVNNDGYSIITGSSAASENVTITKDAKNKTEKAALNVAVKTTGKMLTITADKSLFAYDATTLTNNKVTIEVKNEKGAIVTPAAYAAGAASGIKFFKASVSDIDDDANRDAAIDAFYTFTPATGVIAFNTAITAAVSGNYKVKIALATGQYGVFNLRVVPENYIAVTELQLSEGEGETAWDSANEETVPTVITSTFNAKVLPFDANDDSKSASVREVIATSSDESVLKVGVTAPVAPSTTSIIDLYGVKPGTATITVTADGGITKTYVATVKGISSIVVKGESEVKLGDSTTYTADVTKFGTGIPSTVTWDVDDSSVATITASGVLTAKKVGTVNVTATSSFDGTIKSESFKVSVVEKTTKETEEEAAAKKKAEEEAAAKKAAEEAAKKAAEEAKKGVPAGTTKTVSGTTYKGIDGTSVQITKTANKKSVKIGKTVTVDGKVLKVTKIGSKAVTGKKVKNVTIDASNIKKASNININMFKGAKNLTSVKIKGAKKGSAVYKRIVKAAQKVNKNVKIK